MPAGELSGRSRTPNRHTTTGSRHRQHSRRRQNERARRRLVTRRLLSEDRIDQVGLVQVWFGLGVVGPKPDNSVSLRPQCATGAIRVQSSTMGFLVAVRVQPLAGLGTVQANGCDAAFRDDSKRYEMVLVLCWNLPSEGQFDFARIDLHEGNE